MATEEEGNAVCAEEPVHLPIEVWSDIFAMLSVRDLLTGAGATCLDLRALALDDALWKRLCLRDIAYLPSSAVTDGLCSRMRRPL